MGLRHWLCTYLFNIVQYRIQLLYMLTKRALVHYECWNSRCPWSLFLLSREINQLSPSEHALRLICDWFRAHSSWSIGRSKQSPFFPLSWQAKWWKDTYESPACSLWLWASVIAALSVCLFPVLPSSLRFGRWTRPWPGLEPLAASYSLLLAID